MILRDQYQRLTEDVTLIPYSVFQLQVVIVLFKTWNQISIHHIAEVLFDNNNSQNVGDGIWFRICDIQSVFVISPVLQ